MSFRPQVEQLLIPGPAGQLEAIVEVPADAGAEFVAVVCHPHPLYGGTMTNKVVHMLARAFNELAMPAVRFNFRGIGRSAGTYDEGRGETSDCEAVAHWAAKRWPTARLVLGGFSFGGAVAIRAAAELAPAKLVTVAPAIRKVEVGPEHIPVCPWLIVQGDSDELVDATDIKQWAHGLPQPPVLKCLAGVDHFFHGKLNELRDTVVDWMRNG
ncbi:MAG TPA: alpha/beta family hydrolase [Steroidobacteraceae bacterium]|nr:alpha/beta family hydrolase [Steroidobacteraceae bacterium]